VELADFFVFWLWDHQDFSSEKEMHKKKMGGQPYAIYQM
jgi:hypothetical protein